MSRSTDAPELTRRERDVLALLVRGCGDKEICARLGMAYGTVRTHVGRIYAAYGVTSRATLVAQWHRRARRRQVAT